jgi:hypothetical protein
MVATKAARTSKHANCGMRKSACVNAKHVMRQSQRSDKQFTAVTTKEPPAPIVEDASDYNEWYVVKQQPALAEDASDSNEWCIVKQQPALPEDVSI